MVMSAWSIHLATLFSLTRRLTSNSCTTFTFNWQQPFLNQPKGWEWLKKLFHDQSPRKYGARPGSNSQTLDLQSDTLPTALCGPAHSDGIYHKPTPEYCFVLEPVQTLIENYILRHLNLVFTVCQSTVNVLKFRILVACWKGLAKRGRPRSDCFRSSSLFAILTTILWIPAR